MIAFNKVNLKFDDIIVFEDFSEQFEENKISCIVGPSACGKTTLLNLISGILKEDSGQITKPQKVSYVFQEEFLIQQKTARQNLEIILRCIYKKIELKEVIDKFLKLVGLDAAQHLYPHQMSGGMRQRLSLARAFAYPSEVLLMDEPFKALDITLRDSIIKVFLNLCDKDKRTVVFVTHDIDEALLTGDSIYVYNHKPLRLQKKFEITDPQKSRKLYNESLIRIKQEIYRETETWQISEQLAK